MESEEDPWLSEVALKQAEQKVVDMMVGRGGLMVCEQALCKQLICVFYPGRYQMFKDDRNFTVDMAPIAYGS